MYANNDTTHATEVVEKYINLYSHKLPHFNIPSTFITQCLNTIMTKNIIQFGNTHWVQVNYSFLYIGLLEMQELVKDFELWLPFYA